ncbi:hypothetical protein H113_05198 [Trichophyton rubrum MR1459]|uniref:Integral membrane protein n=1 Tax=Trichophyton rubrum (strain ATCC MYA-4607 / CBS 118892) TaxID=559305 RepID=F2SLI6_TRIRC|nr:uncharacterized protein TERG_02899 [Trichophyton rubrum CBS 118892]EGD86642.2 hypothetical protein TERG_02899 [Trichophyton rubrum CBS 118892]EZF94279.1 hypothetical protein H113_05198 [Trichophyton rubrum MR1459]EZG05254.1 hypothetical protein H106_04997 [Trichophyton rubrum CBS 735.88]
MSPPVLSKIWPGPPESSEKAPRQSFLARRPAIPHRILHSLIYFVAFVMLLLVQIGNLSDRLVLRDIYFLKIDLSNIIPLTVPNAVLINSIARTIGLHDFYQVGLWGFCEGYGDGSGITRCSKPKPTYAFNPVEIITSELLAGATKTLLIIPVVLPSGITRALNIARVASNWMFGFFITATILTFLCMILTPFSIPSSAAILSAPNYSSYYRAKKRAAPSKIAIPIAILAWGAWFTTSAGAAVATVMFVIFQIVFENNAADLNVHAELGIAMMALMWIPVALVTIGFLLQLRKLTGSCRNCCYYCCCCCLFPSARKAHDKSKITR